MGSSQGACMLHFCSSQLPLPSSQSQDTKFFSAASLRACQADKVQISHGRNAAVQTDHNYTSQQINGIPRKEGIFNITGETRFPLEDMCILKTREDSYDGVIVDPNSLPSDELAFLKNLRASLALWRSQKKRGVWLKLPTEKANLVPVAIKEGFQYHHAEPMYVMLTYWIPESPCTLPLNASHHIGIGAFVMNEKREVLVVQERYGPMRGSGVWKFPTGLIDQEEDLCVGAVREVKEETGVETEFLEIVGFRHKHRVSFDKSDLFFLCVLRPRSFEIVKQEGEIEAAKWMALEEFRKQPLYCENALRKKMVDLCIAYSEKHYNGFSQWPTQTRSCNHSSLYYNIQDFDEAC